ncbi:hypothetical protein BD410DRAFT_824014 [Rickenella mellea]|uniref:F-box domain-containing protein n=1 Tax=Rickenella mellea TaxID=50990 RepID=A0A4R5XFY2_9AGAM|nr:hypothetical protein BD410DRAFT_824014 [Rickenella mellea]
MQNDLSEPLKSIDALSSPPMPNLNELTWSMTYVALRAQKAIQARLLQEMQKVEASISFLQMSRNKLALRRGLHLLPDEMLAEIFESGYTPDLKGSQFAVIISHVNRRFRNISLRMPQLWSTIINRQRASEVEEFLLRSKDKGIIVRLLHAEKPAIPSNKFIPIVVRHSQRWIEFEHVFDEDITAKSNLSKYTLDLPKLRKLANRSAYLGPALPKWTMPNLMDYEGDFVSNFFPKTLVTCTLELWGTADNIGLDELLSFMSNNPTLRSLSLVFHAFVRWQCVGSDRVDATAKATLSSLETFSVHFSEGCYVDDNFERFARNLDLPNITQLSLRLSFNGHARASADSSTSRLFRVLFPSSNPYPTLEKLDLIIDAFYTITGTTLEDLLVKLPSLRRLHVETPGWDP